MDTHGCKAVVESESSVITTDNRPQFGDKQQQQQQQSDKYLPVELWQDILARLPFKYLCLAECVCKSWNNYSHRLRKVIDNDPRYVPLCALLLLSHNPQGEAQEIRDVWLSYFCRPSNQNFVIRYDSHEISTSIYLCAFSSGFPVDLHFDFSILHNNLPERPFRFFGMHRGLLHLTYTDGTDQVRNPVTNQIYTVPKSPIIEKYGFEKHTVEEMRGLIIQLRPYRKLRCGFIIVRFCGGLSSMEYYRTWTREWESYQFRLDDETHKLCLRNYVCFLDNGVLSLYVLTSGNFGVAIKFKGIMNAETRHHTFGLPQVVSDVNSARIWESEDKLYLTFYNDTGLWVWNAGSTKADAWSWVPVLEISPTRVLGKSYAIGFLTHVVYKPHIPVKPLAFDPKHPFLYFMVESFMYAYNFNTDIVWMMAELNVDSKLVDGVHPFTPCLRLIESGNGE